MFGGLRTKGLALRWTVPEYPIGAGAFCQSWTPPLIELLLPSSSWPFVPTAPATVLLFPIVMKSLPTMPSTGKGSTPVEDTTRWMTRFVTPPAVPVATMQRWSTDEPKSEPVQPVVTGSEVW